VATRILSVTEGLIVATGIAHVLKREPMTMVPGESSRERAIAPDERGYQALAPR
jgi:hypothetical protein